MSANVQLAQRQLDAYNRQDLDAYVACFAPDVAVASLSGEVERGREALRARYAKTFATFPQNKARLVARMAVGNTVIDHEHVVRAPGGEEFEIIAIYTFKDGLISHVGFAK